MEKNQMKNDNNAHFDLVRLQNRKLIRNLLRLESPLSISSLASKAALSYPTVSALLKELNASNQVFVAQESESCGGRPGIRYALNGAYQYALILYFEDCYLRIKVYDACGSSVYESKVQVSDDYSVEDMVDLVGKIKEKYETLSAVSIGIPGVAHNGVIRFLPKYPSLEGEGLFQTLEELFSVDVFILNDINAIALAEAMEWENFAHIVYVNDCIGTGIVINGEVFGGSRGYAGELEYLCTNLRDPVLTFTETILSITSVLDLPYILISCEQCDKSIVSQVEENLIKKIPKERIPQIHIIEDATRIYPQGLYQCVEQKWREE